MLSWFIARRYASFGSRKHFIGFISRVAMVSIALGVMVLITVLSVMNGFPHEVQERILRVTPHISAYHPDNSVINFTNSNIQSQAKVYELDGMLNANGIVRSIRALGIDEIDSVFPLSESIVSGRGALNSGNFEIILGDTLAQNLAVGVGDVVTLVVPEFDYTIVGAVPKLKQFKVVGLFHVDFMHDSTTAFISQNDASRLVPKVLPTSYFKVNNAFRAAKVRREMMQAHPTVSFSDWTLQNQAYFEAVKLEKNMMFIILMLIIAMSVFNVASTLVMVVTDKKSDIAILRMQGASSRFIKQIFLWQGLIIGFIGVFFGVVLGILLSLYISDIVKAIELILGVQFLSADLYYISFLPSKLEYYDVALVAISTLFMSVLAAWYPASRAAKIEPAKALRDE